MQTLKEIYALNCGRREVGKVDGKRRLTSRMKMNCPQIPVLFILESRMNPCSAGFYNLTKVVVKGGKMKIIESDSDFRGSGKPLRSPV